MNCDVRLCERPSKVAIANVAPLRGYFGLCEEHHAAVLQSACSLCSRGPRVDGLHCKACAARIRAEEAT